mmetsp:Transcript_7163/g.21038  ORF Transcript_7163/g.21038 Transcript_7163/m.21038 type:complete len:491 (-) Transcript_7163:470-1942(-)
MSVVATMAQTGSWTQSLTPAAPESTMLQQPIRKVYSWRNTAEPHTASWSASTLLSQSSDAMARLLSGEGSVPPAELQVTEDKKVHGGVPRTVSLPHLDAPGSQDASPEGRLGSALGDCASVPPALPLPSAFAGVRSSSTGGEGVVPGGPVGPPQLGALSIGSAAGRRGGGGRPGSAPLRADAVLTAPYQRSPDWPVPLDALDKNVRPPPPQPSHNTLAEALSIPRLLRRSRDHRGSSPVPSAGLDLDDGSNRRGSTDTCPSSVGARHSIGPASNGGGGGMGMRGSRSRGSCDALDLLSSSAQSSHDYAAVSSSYQAAPLQRRKQHGSSDALNLLHAASGSGDWGARARAAAFGPGTSFGAGGGGLMGYYPSGDSSGPHPSLGRSSCGLPFDPSHQQRHRRSSGEWRPRTPEQAPALPMPAVQSGVSQDGSARALQHSGGDSAHPVQVQHLSLLQQQQQQPEAALPVRKRRRAPWEWLKALGRLLRWDWAG